MRNLAILVAAAVVLAADASPASAWLFHLHHHHGHMHAGPVVYQGQAIQAQSVWTDLAASLLPGLLNQMHFRLPGGLELGGGGAGQNGAQTLVPTRVTEKLNELDGRLDGILADSQAILDRIEGKKLTPRKK